MSIKIERKDTAAEKSFFLRGSLSVGLGSRWLFLLKIYVLTVLVFVLAKVAFMLCNHDSSSFTVGDMFSVLGHGLSLDLSTALYVIIVPLLATIFSIWMRLPRWTLKPYWAVIAVAFSLAFVADTSLYAFWHFKLDASCLQYLSTPTEAMASVSVGYLCLRVLLFMLFAILIYYVFTRKTVSFTPLSTLRSKILHTVLFLLLTPLLVIGIRGGTGESTTNIGQVYFSQDQFLNHSAVNPVFSFLSSFEQTASYVPDYKFMDEVECEETLERLFPTESDCPDTLLNTQRPNIVIVLMESCGEIFSSYMPRLQQLKQEGIYFSQCYANSWRTDRGTVCTWSGYPSFPTSSVMKMPSKTRFLPSIAKTLLGEGYNTTYLYGGDINFTNMRSYLVGTGFERLHWMKDYTEEEQHTAEWGVRDDITFQTLAEMIENTGSEPFLIGYSTLSTHEPWDVPLHHFDDEVENAFYYLDQCIGQFIDRMRKTSQWQNLLVVLLPDHGIDFREVTISDPRHNHILMLWLGGAVKEPRLVEQVCNQTDLPATLLGQLGLPHHDFRFSRDVLSRNYVRPFAINTYNNGISMTDSSTFAVYDLDAKKLFIGDDSAGRQLMHIGKAVLQTATNDLKNMK